MAERNRLGFGCLVVFLLPFCAVGTGMAVAAVRQALAGEFAQAGFFALFALTFGGAGFGLMAVAVKGLRASGRQAAREEASPGEPWRWREDWAAGRIHDSNRGTMIFLWIFAGFWNLVSIPAGIFALVEALRSGEKAVLLALLFPLIGLGLLYAAIRSTIRYLKFGVSVLELTTNPGVIGGRLAGVVVTRGDLVPEAGFHLVLSCVRRVTSGVGKNRRTTESVLWQEEATAHPSRRAEGTAVPFAFAIPGAVEATSGTSSDGVAWRLVATAEVPGVDYRGSFEVPVFRTAESAALIEAAVPEPAVEPDLDDFRQPVGSRITVTRNRRGTEIHFPAGRNPGPAVFVTLFFVLWTAVTWLLVTLEAPLLFPVVFGLFDLLLFVGMLRLWLVSTTVQVDRGEVVVSGGLPGTARERRLEGRDIAGIAPKIGMQAGGKAYYDITIALQDGRTVRAGTGIRDKREAEWLAALMRRALKGGPAL